MKSKWTERFVFLQRSLDKVARQVSYKPYCAVIGLEGKSDQGKERMCARNTVAPKDLSTLTNRSCQKVFISHVFNQPRRFPQ